MKKFFLLAMLLLFLLSCSENKPAKKSLIAQSCCSKTEAEGTCSGTKSCSACKNCKYCKHCSKDGGSCGMCK